MFKDITKGSLSSSLHAATTSSKQKLKMAMKHIHSCIYCTAQRKREKNNYKTTTNKPRHTKNTLLCLCLLLFLFSFCFSFFVGAPVASIVMPSSGQPGRGGGQINAPFPNPRYPKMTGSPCQSGRAGKLMHRTPTPGQSRQMNARRQGGASPMASQAREGKLMHQFPSPRYQDNLNKCLKAQVQVPVHPCANECSKGQTGSSSNLFLQITEGLNQNFRAGEIAACQQRCVRSA